MRASRITRSTALTTQLNVTDEIKPGSATTCVLPPLTPITPTTITSTSDDDKTAKFFSRHFVES